MALTQKHRTFLLLIALVTMTSYNLFIYFFTAYPFNVPRNYMVDPIPTRRDLARKILKLHREIEVKAGFHNDVDAPWAKGLLAVVAELDPRVTTMQKESSSHQTQRRVEGSQRSSRGALSDVCPEVFKGRTFDPELEHNFLKEPCNAKEFKKVLTIIISAKGWESQRIVYIINNIRKHYDVDIVLLTFGYLAQSLDIERVFVKRFDASALESQALNQVISVITTPYTLVTNSLVRFNEQASLKRLVRVLEDSDKISVASGAYRDIDGNWHHGCLQATVGNYELKYVRGYEYSLNECMYCDDVLGPFVAKTEFLKKVPMTGTVEGIVMYRDWFLNVLLARSLVVSCPDIMFFVKSEPSMNKSDWLKISQKWSVERVQSFDDKTHKFSCEDAQITCGNIMKTVSSFLVPPCCREKIRKEFGYVQDCAEEIGVHYELQAGSLLGAVKMDGMLPWDFDTDIISDCNDKPIWMSKGYNCMAKKGCHLKVVYGNYWAINCELSTIDINCQYNRTAKLTPEYRQTPTQIDFNGKLTKVAYNPGRVCRNYFGREYLKHAVHWRYSSNSIIPMDDGSGQTPGSWSNCVVPAFHSCIDHFPVDGNIIFKNYECKHP